MKEVKAGHVLAELGFAIALLFSAWEQYAPADVPLQGGQLMFGEQFDSASLLEPRLPKPSWARCGSSKPKLNDRYMDKMHVLGPWALGSFLKQE